MKDKHHGNNLRAIRYWKLSPPHFQDISCLKKGHGRLLTQASIRKTFDSGFRSKAKRYKPRY